MVTIEEQQQRLKNFIQAYNDLEAHKAPYVVYLEENVSEFTIPDDMEFIKKYKELSDKLAAAVAEMNSTI